MTDLINTNGAAIEAAPLTNAMSPPQVVKALFESGYWGGDVRSLSQAYVKVLAGEEFGLTPFTAMSGITIIEGRLGMTANLMATLLQDHDDYDYRVVESTNERCEITFHRKIGDGYDDVIDLGTSEFTIADAQRAGLVKPKSNWEKWPKAMCFARALTQGIRTYCPAVTRGKPAYTPEELGAAINENGEAVDVAAPDPIDGTDEGAVTDAVVELDTDRFDHIRKAFDLAGPDLMEVQLMLGACGIDSIDSMDDLEDRLRFLTDEQFDRLLTELNGYADRSAESEADASGDGEIEAGKETADVA